MAQKKVYDEEFRNSGGEARKRDRIQQSGNRTGCRRRYATCRNKRAKDARLDLEPGTQTPDTAMSLTEEVQKLRQQTREQAKEIAR